LLRTDSGGTYSGNQTFNWAVDANPPQLTVPDDMTVNTGDNVTLQANASAPSGIASVEWQFSHNGEDFQTDPNLTTLTIQYTFGYGDYDVLVKVTDNNGEISEDSFHVTTTEVARQLANVTNGTLAAEGVPTPDHLNRFANHGQPTEVRDLIAQLTTGPNAPFPGRVEVQEVP
jgi:hypothetical protein